MRIYASINLRLPLSHCPGVAPDTKIQIRCFFNPRNFHSSREIVAVVDKVDGRLESPPVSPLNIGYIMGVFMFFSLSLSHIFK